MFNPATVTPPRDTLNVFTEILKERCLRDGTCTVTIRDGREFAVEYYEEEHDYKGFRYSNRSQNISLCWELCGTSVTAKRFDIVSFSE